MDYSALDPILEAWARRHGLFVSKSYKGDDVRSVLIVDDAGGEYQLWLTIPDPKGQLTVTVAKAMLARADFETRIEDLSAALEEAYRRVETWISAAGHTRTPVL